MIFANSILLVIPFPPTAYRKHFKITIQGYFCVFKQQKTVLVMAVHLINHIAIIKGMWKLLGVFKLSQ